ncbi:MULTISPECIES: LPO_1073/Vpar_1526 family protein [Pseudomonas]|uniref:LPO_1073/Vpar_1526 family protein n=1 Tax=Pseudomonas TaxID=286 RepID=UPI0008760F1C|nr:MULTISPECIES: LPO_1073/Vpar_1526 family protein [Pseudomonas]SCZ38116.1 hypothetical protein SAMN03159313_4736 [Pseudomonas sp. NFIX46]SDB46316.1 hypothetical protein SAMN03097715_03419 [Pseudomonas putida]SFQ91884.1 hypothetical protein SAMN03159312_4621 [Pseudomonas sp. NFIX49]
MLNKDQNQDVGAGGIAMQAGGNIVFGISAADARAIALDVAKATFYELSGVAKDAMIARVEEITDKFISRLENEFPEGLKKAIDPDFQHALYTVQKNYGRTNDKDLGDLLVDILVDRSKQDQRDFMQIVLTESLDVAPKLTPSQISALSVSFFLGNSAMQGMSTDDQLFELFDKFLMPFVDSAAISEPSIQHLIFAGCAMHDIGSVSLEEILFQRYPFFFLHGYSLEDINNSGVSANQIQNFFMYCLNDKDKGQVAAINDNVLREKFEVFQASESDRTIISGMLNGNRMSAENIRSKCVQARPYMDEIFSIWNSSSLGRLRLTSVGSAIAHANIKRLVGEFADLSIWIN